MDRISTGQSLYSQQSKKLDKYSDKFWFYLEGKSNLLLEKAIY
jgi:hypothetical protein